MRNKRLVCWKSESDCIAYYKEEKKTDQNDLKDEVDRAMTRGTSKRFRDEEHLREFRGKYSVIVI